MGETYVSNTKTTIHSNAPLCGDITHFQKWNLNFSYASLYISKSNDLFKTITYFAPSSFCIYMFDSPSCFIGCVNYENLLVNHLCYMPLWSIIVLYAALRHDWDQLKSMLSFHLKQVWGRPASILAYIIMLFCNKKIISVKIPEYKFYPLSPISPLGPLWVSGGEDDKRSTKFFIRRDLPRVGEKVGWWYFQSHLPSQFFSCHLRWGCCFYFFYMTCYYYGKKLLDKSALR